jgi:uncharacterized protein (DUF58 family)
MGLRVIPGRTVIRALAAIAVAMFAALLMGVAVMIAAWMSVACVLALLAAALWDYAASRRAWRLGSPRMTRRLPAAFAIGAKRAVQLGIEIDGSHAWQCDVYDHADATFLTQELPLRLVLQGGTRLETTYTVTPTRRGEVTFAPADVRVRSRWGLCELLERLGTSDLRRVYPDFAQVARYAWLAGDRRLQEIGVKTYHQRGEGTDFKELSEYRMGDSLRHMDWRATLKHAKPIMRQFQDERDQCVMLLVDCGRRMRADDRNGAVGGTHFDHVLNAVMLLAYVALKHGDAVGAMTFGTPAGEERSFAPRKGAPALNALMGELYGVQPTPTHTDYVTAAEDLLRRQRRRALVIVITNFRDEDSTELGQALRLLRSRHLVLLASLREGIVGELMAQPLATRDALMVDAEPQRLGIELVNRYHAMKRAGTI